MLGLENWRTFQNFQTEEPDEKYSIHAGNHQQLMMNPAVMAGSQFWSYFFQNWKSEITVPNARGLQPNVGFPLMQYCQMIQQMQHHHQQMEYPMPMIRKDNKDEGEYRIVFFIFFNDASQFCY